MLTIMAMNTLIMFLALRQTYLNRTKKLPRLLLGLLALSNMYALVVTLYA